MRRVGIVLRRRRWCGLSGWLRLRTELLERASEAFRQCAETLGESGEALVEGVEEFFGREAGVAGKLVQDLAGAVEFRKKFFFAAEFRRMREQRATGAAGGMLDVKHLVIEDVFDGVGRDGGMIHAAVEDDLVGAGIEAAELATPVAGAPTDVGALEPASKELRV